jgi:hypothetical protein
MFRGTSNLDREGELMTNKSLTIRRSDVADSGALARLAVLDSSAPLSGDALVAEVGDELWAAVEIDTGIAVADPFRPSADLVDLLRLRAGHLRGDGVGARRRLAFLLPRPA